jgi:hypothetical protein
MVQQKRKASDDGDNEAVWKCPFAMREANGVSSSNTQSVSTASLSTCSTPTSTPSSFFSGMQGANNDVVVSENDVVNETDEGMENDSSQMQVDAEESQALREFDVLDEEDYDQDSDNQSEESYDSDVPDEEIEAMLEEGINT